MPTPTFTTAQEVLTAIQQIGLNTTIPALAAISRNGKQEFLDCLTVCVQKEDPEGKFKKYVEGVLRCLDETTLGLLQEVVPEITVDQVTLAAKRSPNRILSAIELTRDKNNPRYGDAVEFLKTIALPAPNPTPEPQVPSRPAANVPSRAEERQSAPPPEQRQAARGQSTAPVAEDSAKKHSSHHVYGSNFALCFNATEWNGAPTIMVDAAESNGPKSYDWKNAVHISLKAIEIAACVAVFRRWRKEVSFDAHGSQNDKSLHLEFQQSHFYAKVAAKGLKVRAVKITSGDATAVSILFLRQLAEAYKGIPLSELLATVRATHQLDNAA